MTKVFTDSNHSEHRQEKYESVTPYARQLYKATENPHDKSPDLLKCDKS